MTELPQGPAPSPARLAEALAARERSLASFRGQARLRYEGPENKLRSNQMILVRDPGSIRIDVMNPFGVSYSLATDGARLTAFDHREDVFYSGAASARNFARFAGVAKAVERLEKRLSRAGYESEWDSELRRQLGAEQRVKAGGYNTSFEKPKTRDPLERVRALLGEAGE